MDLFELETLELKVEVLKMVKDALSNPKKPEFATKAILCPVCLSRSMVFTYPCCGEPYWDCWGCGNRQRKAPVAVYNEILLGSTENRNDNAAI